MATINQIEYITKVKDKIKEPILIIGSKIYDYDARNIESELNKLGFSDITGIDIFEGVGVDYVVDITNENSEFFKEKKEYYNTVICMEVLTHVPYPWLAGKNINHVTSNDSCVIVSECFVRKFSRMPTDYWRFTYDSFKILFSDFIFDETLAMKSLTRAKVSCLENFNNEIYQIMHERGNNESLIAYYIRSFHRKYFGGKIFAVSRILPEQTFYALGIKK